MFCVSMQSGIFFVIGILLIITGLCHVFSLYLPCFGSDLIIFSCDHQGDVCAACGIAEDDMHRVLKPYQLVGVNFMLLLYRKNVGGGMIALNPSCSGESHQPT